MGVRAKLGDVVAAGSGQTPGRSGHEGEAQAARVVRGTAARHTNASSLGGAPCIVGSTYTLAAVIVVERAFDGNDTAGVGGRAPGRERLEAQTIATAIAQDATVGYFDAIVANRAPGEPQVAYALSTVVVGDRA